MASISRSLLLMLCLAVSAQAEEAPSPASADVRILIDVSGSMVKTDPFNLRVPAFKLLVSLLPPDAQAGVWMFAEQPQLLLSLGKTDKAWKKQALDDASKINSRGLFTDIEAALDQSIDDWKKATTLAGKRHLILLTDGMVDVSKEASKSAESRQRIFDVIIPKLQQLGIQTHTIALSDQADKELLKKLSQDTGGWHESIQAADQLGRMFAKIVAKTTPHDNVPLQGNKFTVDASIQEFSLLVFLQPNAEPTRLVRPDKQEISELMIQPNVHWRHESGYDLITVDHPLPGEWTLIAKTDPDNEVVVITDLKLVTKELPNYLTKGDALNIAAHFTEQGTTITKEDFLKLISLQVKHNNSEEQALAADVNNPGYFSATLKDLALGKHTLSISADGKTFQRETSHSLEVVEQLVSYTVTSDNTATPPLLLIALSVNKAILDVNNTQISAKLSNAYGQNTDVAVPGNNGAWLLKLPLPSPQELLTINFTVNTKTLDGKAMRPSVPPLVFNSQTLTPLLNPAVVTPLAAPPKPEAPAPEPAKPEKEPLPPAQPEPAVEPAPSVVPEKGAGTLVTVIAAIVINLMLAVGGWFGYRAYKKRVALKQSELLDGLGALDDDTTDI